MRGESTYTAAAHRDARLRPLGLAEGCRTSHWPEIRLLAAVAPIRLSCRFVYFVSSRRKTLPLDEVKRNETRAIGLGSVAVVKSPQGVI